MVAGDVERVVGALATTESLVDATVESDVLEPWVRRANAARRGRGALGAGAPLGGAFMCILAAS